MEEPNIAPGDFDWFTKLPEYLAWSSSGYATVLWYADPPGSGKTSLVRNLVVKLLDRQRHNQNIDVAYSLCPLSRSVGQTPPQPHILPATILRSIIGQLLSRGDNNRIAEIEATVKSGGKTLVKLLGDDDTMLKELWEIFTLVLKSTPKPPQNQEVYIVIDAIEEVESNAQVEFSKELLKLWRALQSKRSCVIRFLIATHPSPEIRDILKDVPFIDKNIERKRQYFTPLLSVPCSN